MEELPGASGTSASLALRFGQTVFASASLFFMCVDVQFYSYTVFCYLVTVMGMVVPWSLTIAVVDGYSVFIRYLPLQPKIMSTIIVGDWLLAFLSQLLVPQLALRVSCSTMVGPIIQPSYAVDIDSRLPWRSGLGFFH